MFPVLKLLQSILSPSRAVLSLFSTDLDLVPFEHLFLKRCGPIRKLCPCFQSDVVRFKRRAPFPHVLSCLSSGLLPFLKCSGPFRAEQFAPFSDTRLSVTCGFADAEGPSCFISCVLVERLAPECSSSLPLVLKLSLLRAVCSSSQLLQSPSGGFHLQKRQKCKKCTT